MDFFNEYLKGKHFNTDHKPLEKLGHLHSNMLNRLQMALLEHDFVIQYKKGSNMPEDQRSHRQHFRFRSISMDLYNLQMQDDDLQMLQTFMTKNEWPPNLPKQDRPYFKMLAERAFQDKNKVVLVHLNDFNYPRTALYLPSRYRYTQPCARHTMVFLEDTMLRIKPT
jgi:hypothetical protein